MNKILRSLTDVDSNKIRYLGLDLISIVMIGLMVVLGFQCTGNLMHTWGDLTSNGVISAAGIYFFFNVAGVLSALFFIFVFGLFVYSNVHINTRIEKETPNVISQEKEDRIMPKSIKDFDEDFINLVMEHLKTFMETLPQEWTLVSGLAVPSEDGSEVEVISLHRGADKDKALAGLLLDSKLLYEGVVDSALMVLEDSVKEPQEDKTEEVMDDMDRAIEELYGSYGMTTEEADAAEERLESIYDETGVFDDSYETNGRR